MSSVINRLLTAINAHDLEAFLSCYDSEVTIKDGNDRIFARGHQEDRVTGKESESDHHIAVYQLKSERILRERLLR